MQAHTVITLNWSVFGSCGFLTKGDMVRATVRQMSKCKNIQYSNRFFFNLQVSIMLLLCAIQSFIYCYFREWQVFLSWLPQQLEPHVRNQSNTNDSEREELDVSDIITCTKPAQPDPKFIVVQKWAKCVLLFQQKCSTTFPWLHYNAILQVVLCVHCAKVYSHLSKFEKIQLHIHAMNIYAQKGNTVASQLSSAVARQEEEARHELLKIVGSIKFLAWQGLALRGHVERKGYLSQYLKEKAEVNIVFQKWLETHKQDYTSSLIPNEILGIMSNNILIGIANSIRCLPVCLNFWWDTRHIRTRTRICMSSLCDLISHKEFIGMYSVTKTTWDSLSKVALDQSSRLTFCHGCIGAHQHNS